MGTAPQAQINALVKHLELMGLEPSALDVADLLWLALRRASDLGRSNLSDLTTPPQHDSITPASPVQSKDKIVDQTISTEQRRQTVEAGGSVPLHAEQPGASAESGRLPLAVPLPSALPHKLELGRAIRSLRRQVPAPQRQVLDEEASARRIAETRIWVPVLRPSSSRWLDVALVVDTAPAMLIWQRTVDELQRVLAHSGVFRDVRRWQLGTDRTDAIHLAPLGAPSGGASRSPRELLDPTGRRLILILSDCVAPSWRGNAAAHFLTSLAAKSCVALIQLLPYRLWERTELGRHPIALIGAGPAGAPSAQLPARLARRSFRPTTGTPLPVASLEVDSIATLARLIVGVPKTIIGGVLLRADLPSSVQGATPDLDTLLSNFQLHATEEAQDLMRALAVAPLSAPVMHLVHYHAVAAPRTEQMAEVLLSGLIRRDQATHTGDAVAYEFIPGAREALQQDLPHGLGLGLLRRISEYVAEHNGQPNRFRAMLADPHNADYAALQADNPEFATVAASYLKRLEGKYAEIGQRIEEWNQNTGASAQASVLRSTSPSPPQDLQIDSISPSTEVGDEDELRVADLDTVTQRSAHSAEEVRSPTSQARILIADDDPALCLLLGETLQDASYDVMIASNGDELVRMAQDQPPDLLLVDLMMPLMDGFEAIRQLRNDTRTAHLPMIILTGRNTSSDVVTGLDSGADDYIIKPYDIDVLLARIRSHLRRSSQLPVRNPLTGMLSNVRSAHSAEEVRSPTSQARILIADDDPALCLLLGETLQDANYDVMIASNGDELVRLAQDQPPDLLLVDLMMPLMDGFEAIRQLRNDIRTAHLPMIILTACSTSPEVVTGFDSGADDYIIKPYDIDVLLARIRSHLRRAAQLPRSEELIIRVRDLVQAQRFGEARAATDAILNDDDRAMALSDLAAALTQAQRWDDARATADAIGDEQWRYEALGALAAASAQAGLFDLSRTAAQAIPLETKRSQALRALVEALTQAGQFAEARVIAETISDAQVRSAALKTMISAEIKAQSKVKPEARPNHAADWLCFMIRKSPDLSNHLYSLHTFIITDEKPIRIRLIRNAESAYSLAQLWEQGQQHLSSIRPSVNREPNIAFFLPLEMLIQEVDQWIVQTRPFSVSLGIRNIVTVQCIEVLENGRYKDVASKRERRWRELHTETKLIGERLHWVMQIEEWEDPERLFKELVSGRYLSVAVIPPAPIDIQDHRWEGVLAAIVEAGIPIAVILRKHLPSGHTDLLQSRLAACPVMELPQLILELRKEAAKNADADSLGRHLTLLWDDPSLYPFDLPPELL